MKNTGDQLAENLKTNCTLKELAAVQVQYAYHVTNVKVEYKDKEKKERTRHPDWQQLEWHLADDNYFDGPILFGAPCVFFTTTLCGKGIPDFTMYPRYGEVNEEYWRINIPLTHFNDYEIIFAHEIEKQVRILLLKNEDTTEIPATKLRERNAAKYFRRDGGGNAVKYYSNKYSSTTHYFVNLAVCNDVSIPDTRVWDTVKRTIGKSGSVDTAAMITRLENEGFTRDELKKSTMDNPDSGEREALRKRLVRRVVDLL